MIKAFAIAGPTASGKTALSLSVAEHFGCEIICCDSMQIYKEMDVGTAKATAAERARVPHHVVDFLDPRESFSAEGYREAAMEAARDITARGRIPLFVGGTGLYLDTLIRGTAEAPKADVGYRERMMRIAEGEGGIDTLWERLLRVDPESAAAIHKNNVKRVIRALEIYDATGVPKTELDRQTREVDSEIDICLLTLDVHDRENLYRRVDTRVDMMMEEGLLSEVTGLYERGMLQPETTAAQAIGYKEIVGYLEGKYALSEAVDSIKLASRRYAKRQLTWFRHERERHVLFIDREDGSMKDAAELLAEAIEIFDAKKRKDITPM